MSSLVTVTMGRFNSEAFTYNGAKRNPLTEIVTKGVLQKKGVLRNFTKFTKKSHVPESLF